MAVYKEIRGPELNCEGLGTRYDEVAECNGRQIRPQDAKFLEFLAGTTLHQQRNEIPHPATLEPCIRVLYHGGDVAVRKSRIFFREATLDVTDQHPLFWRHLDIVAPSPESGQDAFCKRLVV